MKVFHVITFTAGFFWKIFFADCFRLLGKERSLFRSLCRLPNLIAIQRDLCIVTNHFSHSTSLKLMNESASCHNLHCWFLLKNFLRRLFPTFWRKHEPVHLAHHFSTGCTCRSSQNFWLLFPAKKILVSLNLFFLKLNHVEWYRNEPACIKPFLGCNIIFNKISCCVCLS